jgi:predicted Zn-ribbon and HTH transcriptional regulator
MKDKKKREEAFRQLCSINKVRAFAGLPRLVERPRKCLRCDSHFTSTQDRLCPKCKQYSVAAGLNPDGTSIG